MSRTPAPYELMPSDLPPLSDSAAVLILDFLHEMLYRFGAHYAGQIHRFYEQREDLFVNPPVAPVPEEGDIPF